MEGGGSLNTSQIKSLMCAQTDICATVLYNILCGSRVDL